MLVTIGALRLSIKPISDLSYSHHSVLLNQANIFSFKFSLLSFIPIYTFKY